MEPRQRLAELAPLCAALALFLACALGYVRALPVFEAPDEPGHYDYAFRLDTAGARPYLVGTATAAGATSWDESSMGHHPSLYYWVLVAIGRATAGEIATPIVNHVAEPGRFHVSHGADELAPRSREVNAFLLLRRFSVLCGAISLVLVFATGRILAPDRPLVAGGATLLLAALPQWQSSHAVLDNGALATTLSFAAIALLASLWTRAGRGFEREVGGPGAVSWVEALALGTLVGAALATKLTSIFLLGPALAVAVRVVLCSANRRSAFLRCVATLAVVALCVAPFVLDNLERYGEPLARGAHERSYAASVIPPELRSDYLFGLHELSFLPSLAASLVGNFGWNAMDAPPLSEWLFGATALVGVLGWVLGRNRSLALLPLLLPAILLVFAQVALYNWTFHQPQGRYLFPGVGALALLLAGGVLALLARVPRRVGAVLAVAIAALLAADSLRLAFDRVPRFFEPPIDANRLRTAFVAGPSHPGAIAVSSPEEGELLGAPPTFRFTPPATAPADAVFSIDLWRADGTYLGGSFRSFGIALETHEWTLPELPFRGIPAGTILWQVRRIPDRTRGESGHGVEASELRSFAKR